MLKKTPITILWRIDEVQQIDTHLTVDHVDDKKKLEEDLNDKRRSNILYRYIRFWMSLVVDAGGSPTFFVPVCSGTSDYFVTQIMPKSYYRSVSIPMYISDISMNTAIDMMNSEIQLPVQIKNWKLYVHALGPVPRLLQYSCIYLRDNPNSTLKDLHVHISGKIKDWYQIQFEEIKHAAFILMAILDQWDFRKVGALNP